MHDRCDPVCLVDPLVIDKHMDRYRKGSRKLVDTARYYGVELTEAEAHTAYGDALAAALVARKLGEKYPAVGSMTPFQLHTAQALWYAEQAASFEAYLRRQGKNDTISREWPVRTAVSA